ncbi:acetate--CoA ligase family protein [Streptomyces sp. L7]
MDLAGAGEADLQVYAQVAELVAPPARSTPSSCRGIWVATARTRRALVDAESAVIDRLALRNRAGAAGVPLIVHSMSAASPAVARLREHRIPGLQDTVDAALGALGHVTRLGGQPRPMTAMTVRGETTVPGPGYWAARTVPDGPRRRDARGTTGHGRGRVRAGLRVPASAACAQGRLIEHQERTPGRQNWIGPGHRRRGVPRDVRGGSDRASTSSRSRTRGRESSRMLIGARRDRDFGPTVAVGHGGVHAELWRDVSVELAPVDRRTAAGMLDRLRSRGLLDGWRGQPAVDVEALIDAIVAVSEAIAATPGVADIEVNPIRVGLGRTRRRRARRLQRRRSRTRSNRGERPPGNHRGAGDYLA